MHIYRHPTKYTTHNTQHTHTHTHILTSWFFETQTLSGDALDCLSITEWSGEKRRGAERRGLEQKGSLFSATQPVPTAFSLGVQERLAPMLLLCSLKPLERALPQIILLSAPSARSPQRCKSTLACLSLERRKKRKREKGGEREKERE